MIPSAACPICGAANACPCPRCREISPDPALRYGFVPGRNGQPDTVICGNCGFEGPITEWGMSA